MSLTEDLHTSKRGKFSKKQNQKHMQENKKKHMQENKNNTCNKLSHANNIKVRASVHYQKTKQTVCWVIVNYYMNYNANTRAFL